MIGFWRSAAVGGAFAIGLATSASLRAAVGDPPAGSLAQMLAAAEARHGKASPNLLPVLDQLAQSQARDGALDEAAALRRRALAIAIGGFGGGSAKAAEAMTALATVYIGLRRYLDAEPLLIVAERLLGEGSAAARPTAAATYAGLARIALSRGETRFSEDFARRAVAAAALSSAEPLRALGAALVAEQRFDEAERVLTEALTQDRKRQGRDGDDTARSLSQLANLYLRQGRAGDALPLLEQALGIDQRRLGAKHPFIADDLHDLGLVYDALKRPREARRAFEAAIAVLDRGVGRNTPRVAYAQIELSRLYRKAGEDAAADAAWKDARRILNKAEAEEHKRERQT